MRNIEKIGFNEQDYEIYKDCFKNTFISRVVVSKDDIYQKHDKIFKSVLKNPNEMSVFLRTFVELKVNIKNLEIYNCNFITKDFYRRESDIVYKQNNEDIYYIVEQQTKVDKDMPRRILEYCVELMREIKQNKNIIKNPLIIPIVIYTGDRNWNVPTIFSDTQNSKTYAQKYAIKSIYELIDINKYSNTELKNINTRISKLLLLEKCKNKIELSNVIEYLAKTSENREEINWINDVVFYVLKNTFNQEEKTEIVKILEEKEGNEMDDLIERINRNEKIRDKNNIKKGQKEKQIEIAKRMKLKNMSINDIVDITGLSRKELLNIKSFKI